MSAWPFPGDSPLARARRVAQAYRTALEQHAPDTCQGLDALMGRYGETWVAPAVQHHHPDDWVRAAQAADLACVNPAQLRVWRARGRLTGRPVGNTWEYQVRDVLSLMTHVRHRTRKGQP